MKQIPKILAEAERFRSRRRSLAAQPRGVYLSAG